jgi:formyl-CoA transferase
VVPTITSICLPVANPEHWRRLLRVIGREELLDDPRFATFEAHSRHEAEIDQMILL